VETNIIAAVSSLLRQAGLALEQRIEKGGPGSGYFGHAGRPGEVGGSAPGDEDVDPDSEAGDAAMAPEERNAKRQERRRARRAAARGEEPKQPEITPVPVKPPEPEQKPESPGAQPADPMKPGGYVPHDSVTGALAWLRQVYPGLPLSSNIRDLDISVVNKVILGIDKAVSANPAILTGLASVEMTALDNKNWATATPTTDRSFTSVFISQYWFTREKALNTSLRSGTRAGWHPPGCDTIDSIVVHELGHALMNTVVAGGARNLSASDGERFGPALRAWLDPAKASGEYPSDYAKHNEREFFAESFTSLYYTPVEKQTEATKSLGVLLERFASRGRSR